MILSGVLELVSLGSDVLFVDWTPEIPGGVSILAATTLSGYEQGFSPDFLGSAAAYIRGFTPVGGGFVDLPGDPVNNMRFIDNCQSVLFRLAGRLVHAYSHIIAYQLGGPGGFIVVQHAHRDYEVRHGTRVLGRHRVSTLVEGSRVDVNDVLARSNAHVAAHYGVTVSSLRVTESAESIVGSASTTGIALP
jgi:hypothetical protein